MQNSPFHRDVLAFCNYLVGALAGLLPQLDYQIACEHEHSNCVLIASRARFFKNGTWHTWYSCSYIFMFIL
jgi:tRNA wybutosine-synthesizing protein 1